MQIRYEPFRRRSAEGAVRMLWSVLLLLFLLFPFLTDHGHTGLTCKFHEMTGLSCPTCGMSRSLYELVHLHLADSFGYHLFGPFVYFLAIVFFIKISLENLLGLRIAFGMKNRIAGRVILWTGLLWILYWLVRMATELYS